MDMKRLYILTVIAVMFAVSASAQVAKFFDKYADAEDVTNVYISKTMLRLMPDIKTDDMDLKGLGEKLDYIRILTSVKSSMVSKLKPELTKTVKSSAYEQLVNVNEGKEHTSIYMKSGENGIYDYLIVNEDPGQFNAILIVGKLTPADVQKMMGK